MVESIMVGSIDIGIVGGVDFFFVLLIGVFKKLVVFLLVLSKIKMVG